MKRLIIALLCLAAVSAIVACEGSDDYVKNLKSDYGYTVKKHNVKVSDIEAIEQALDKHEWQKSKSLTKDDAKAEWESFLSDINDEEVEITDGGYVYGAITADAEILLRGQQVFDGVDIVVQGTVNSILPTDYSDEFFLVIYHPSYEGNKIDKIAVKGKYSDSNSRYVVGDQVWFIGKYDRIIQDVLDSFF